MRFFPVFSRGLEKGVQCVAFLEEFKGLSTALVAAK